MGGLRSRPPNGIVNGPVASPAIAECGTGTPAEGASAGCGGNGMGREIERKYLVTGEAYKALGQGTLYRQGYLNSAAERVVRVRTMDAKAWLTIKGPSVGATRAEFEYEIPLADALQLFELCEQPLIEKTRTVVPIGGLIWEIDEFHGVNQGLTMAECELETEDQVVARPDWVGREVTGDPRYFNSNLVARPFTTWRE
jgi:CYTH domain-containing protein